MKLTLTLIFACVTLINRGLKLCLLIESQTVFFKSLLTIATIISVEIRDR